MANHIYNVKQAAKILGLSTNTTYKYLNEGRIKAARGHVRGTFIITTKSLETFLGSKLPDEPLVEAEIASPSIKIKSKGNTEAIIEVQPPTLATKVTRILITLALLILIGDILINKDFSPAPQMARVVVIALIFLISYQFGGFEKK